MLINAKSNPRVNSKIPINHKSNKLLTVDWFKANRVLLNAGIDMYIHKYLIDFSLADYVLFVEDKPVDNIESNRKEEGNKLKAHKLKGLRLYCAKIKYLKNEKLIIVLS
jgi:hypothetical protein